MNKTQITWVNGKAVVHFLEIEDTDYAKDGMNAVSNAYLRAQAKAKPYGGEKVHCRAYGGGIGFNSERAALKCMSALKVREVA